MVEYCCICETVQGVIANVTFHRIPKDVMLKASWFKNIRREVSRASAVCSRHFEEKDFYYKVLGDSVRRFLMPMAVPSLLLLNQNNSDNCIQQTMAHNPQINGDKTVNSKITENVMDPTFGDSYSKISSSNNSKSMENMTNIEGSIYLYENIGVITDEIQFNVNNADNTENDKDTKKLTSKRKMSKPLTGSKRFCSPQGIEDLQREDFTSNRSWQIVCDYMHNSKNKHRILNKKIKRLNQKVKNLQSLMKYLKKSGLLSNEICNALEMSCSFA